MYPFIDNPEWVACLFMDECDTGCPQDLDVDGQVEAFDLAILLGSWGPCEGCPMDFDDDGDSNIGAFDLAVLLGAWGPCCGNGTCDTDEGCGEPNECEQDCGPCP